jgi:predicted TIM-barrel fold metal-dependent hydrolase
VDPTTELAAPPTGYRLIDCDVHQLPPDEEALFPFLPRRYVDQIKDFGSMLPKFSYTNIPGKGARLDLWEQYPDVGNPAFSPEVAVEAHLDKYGVDLAILTGGPYAAGVHPDADYASAYCRAYNDWTAATWLQADARFRASIHISPLDPLLAVAEIRRLAPNPRFVQVLMAAGARLPFGNRFYDPIYAACEELGLPVASHFGGEGMGVSGPPTAAGHPTYYLEMRSARAQMAMAHLASLICEGTFEKFPGFKFLFVEQGFYWVPGFLWQIDADWKSLREYTPWVKRLPSEYVQSHVRFSTQPMIDPPRRKDIATFMDWMHADQLLVFASDYPHFDWDEPAGFLSELDEALRARMLSGNARELYGLD